MLETLPLLTVMAGYDPDDPASLDLPAEDYVAALGRGAEGLRIGLLGGDWLQETLAPIAGAVREAADRLAATRAGLSRGMMGFEETAAGLLPRQERSSRRTGLLTRPDGSGEPSSMRK